MNIEKIKKLKQKYESVWLAYPEVVAVGIGKTSNGATGIIVSVEAESNTMHALIPRVIEGIPVEIQISGKIKTL